MLMDVSPYDALIAVYVVRLPVKLIGTPAAWQASILCHAVRIQTKPLFLDQIHLLHYCACDQEGNLCQDPEKEGC